ncbi:MAG: NnrU family protein, partial [Stappiaceae bacterium]
GYIKKIVKHPQILAIKIWAFSHLLANGDLPSVILFGSFLAWGVTGRISMKRRDRERVGSGNVDGQAKVSADLIAIVVGLAIYALFVWKVHTWLIGVPIV